MKQAGTQESEKADKKKVKEESTNTVLTRHLSDMLLLLVASK